MKCKKPIFKTKEVDIRATLQQLDLQEAAYIPFRTEMKTSAVRTAVCRINQEGERRYSVSETINGTLITRTV